VKIVNSTNIKDANTIIEFLATGINTEILTVHIKNPDKEEADKTRGRFSADNYLPEITIFLRKNFPITMRLSNGQHIKIADTNQYITVIFLIGLYHYTQYQQDLLYELRDEKQAIEEEKQADTYVIKRLKKHGGTIWKTMIF